MGSSWASGALLDSLGIRSGRRVEGPLGARWVVCRRCERPLGSHWVLSGHGANFKPRSAAPKSTALWSQTE
eukprot:7219455-Pyramimonas_sp.AAC.1